MDTLLKNWLKIKAAMGIEGECTDAQRAEIGNLLIAYNLQRIMYTLDDISQHFNNQ